MAALASLLPHRESHPTPPLAALTQQSRPSEEFEQLSGLAAVKLIWRPGLSSRVIFLTWCRVEPSHYVLFDWGSFYSSIIFSEQS